MLLNYKFLKKIKYKKEHFIYSLILCHFLQFICSTHVNAVPLVSKVNGNVFLYSSYVKFNQPSLDLKLNKDEVKNIIEEIYIKRSLALATGDMKELPLYFDTSHKYGTWALEHEVQRVKYLNTWAYTRNIDFTDIKSNIIINKVSENGGRIKVSLKELCKFTYVYKEDENPVSNSFSVGLNHSVTLIKKRDKWLIFNDWYTDCFEDALKKYSGKIEELNYDGKEIISLPNNPKVIEYSSFNKYNRRKAVEYADKYCGVSLNEDEICKYNKKYRNYTGIGGDCTNFASQVLGDKEAGALKFDGTWKCSYHKFSPAEGSKAWVNADAFKNYLIYSGKGRVVSRGKFKDLALTSNKYTYIPLEKLEPGDLICYAKGSNVDHFAIVTAWDSHGYPLVNSHTTDRYHVPWDLGWGDKDIIFYLIKIQ